jgi:hypothetical protein
VQEPRRRTTLEVLQHREQHGEPDRPPVAQETPPAEPDDDDKVVKDMRSFLRRLLSLFRS